MEKETEGLNQYALFGLDDITLRDEGRYGYWWPLWIDEWPIEAPDSKQAAAEAKERAIKGGEPQWVEIIAVPFADLSEYHERVMRDGG